MFRLCFGSVWFCFWFSEGSTRINSGFALSVVYLDCFGVYLVYGWPKVYLLLDDGLFHSFRIGFNLIWNGFGVVLRLVQGVFPVALLFFKSWFGVCLGLV